MKRRADEVLRRGRTAKRRATRALLATAAVAMTALVAAPVASAGTLAPFAGVYTGTVNGGGTVQFEINNNRFVSEFEYANVPETCSSHQDLTFDYLGPNGDRVDKLNKKGIGEFEFDVPAYPDEPQLHGETVVKGKVDLLERKARGTLNASWTSYIMDEADDGSSVTYIPEGTCNTGVVSWKASK